MVLLSWALAIVYIKVRNFLFVAGLCHAEEEYTQPWVNAYFVRQRDSRLTHITN